MGKFLLRSAQIPYLTNKFSQPEKSLFTVSKSRKLIRPTGESEGTAGQFRPAVLAHKRINQKEI